MSAVNWVSVFLLLAGLVGCGKHAQIPPETSSTQPGKMLQAVAPPPVAKVDLVGRWIVTSDGESRPMAFLEFTPIGQSITANLLAPADPLGRKFPVVYSLEGKALNVSCYAGSDEMGGHLELTADGTFRGLFGQKGEEHPATMKRQ